MIASATARLLRMAGAPTGVGTYEVASADIIVVPENAEEIVVTGTTTITRIRANRSDYDVIEPGRTLIIRAGSGANFQITNATTTAISTYGAPILTGNLSLSSEGDNVTLKQNASGAWIQITPLVNIA